MQGDPKEHTNFEKELGPQNKFLLYAKIFRGE
jgi:hypothetical protein